MATSPPIASQSTYGSSELMTLAAGHDGDPVFSGQGCRAMSGGGQGSSKVKFDRRRAAMDSDDDDLDDL